MSQSATIRGVGDFMARNATPGRIALILVLFALALRLAFVLSIPNEIEALNYDGTVYDEIASRVLDGDGYGYEAEGRRSWRPPLYPLLLTGQYWVFGQNFVLVRTTQALLGAATVLLVFSLARSYLGRYGSALAGAMVAVHAGLIFITGRVMTETLFIFLLVAAAVFLQRWFKDWRICDGLAAGILLGLACLTRPPALMVVPLLLPAMLLIGPNVRTQVRRFLVIGLIVLATISPWTLRNYAVHDDFVLITSNGGYNFYVGNNPFATGRLVLPSFSADQARMRSTFKETDLDYQYYRWGLTYIVDQPGDALVLVASKAEVLFFDPSVGKAKYPEWGFLALAILGLAVSIKNWRRYTLVYLFTAALLLPPLFFFADARFRLPAVPFMAMFAAASVVWLAHIIGRWTGWSFESNGPPSASQS